MEDPTVRRLTKKVFPHLWVRHKLMSFVPSTGIFPFSEMTVFAQGIGNAVIVYLHLYRPTLSNYLEKHIPSMPKSKMQFWTHVAFLCLQARLTNDNPFDYFLTTCAITAEVALHCYIDGYDDVLSLASVFFCAFFENELYASFHRAGGWAGLQQYIEDTSCKELHELVDGYIKELDYPSEHLPILITVENEQLAAARREKFMSLLSFKIGEIEREEKTNTLVSRIFHWHFMENHRISEVKRGILKRMENVRHTKTRSNIFMYARRHDEPSQADEIPDAANQISNDFESLSLHGDAQLPESVSTMSKNHSVSNKSIQENDSECTKVRKESKSQLCTIYETSETAKFNSSSSLHELRNFYESLSSSSEKKSDDSKHFRSNNEKHKRLNSSAVKELDNRHDKMNPVETYSRSLVPYSSENGGTFPKSKHFTPETANKSTEPFRVDVLSEFTKSFQELGFKCLCVGNSSHLDEKSANNFANYAEVVEKCRHYQNKYSSIQFAILIPNNCFTSETSHAPETEKCDNNCTVFPETPHSEIENAIFHSTTVDKNQLRSANGLALLQNCAPENIHKSRFVVTKVNEKDLSSIGEALKISRFTVKKVNEDQMILRDDTGLLGNKCTTEPKIISRFTITKVNENRSKDGISIFEGNRKYETKISRFTVTKVNENQSKDGSSIFEENRKTVTKISRFTVTKINESQSKDVTNIFGENRKTATKISRFTVIKVDENNSRDGASASGYWKNGTPKTSRFTVTKVDENELKNGARILRRNWSNGTPQTSRFTVTRVDGNQASLLERNYSSEMPYSPENETVHFQDNGSVKYQKRVSFAELAHIAYYPTYSSDSSPNSITSRESLNQNSPEETESVRNPKNAAKQADTLNPPTPRNPLVTERRRFFNRFSSSESRPLNDIAKRSNLSSASGFFDRLFRRPSSSNSRGDESSTENKEETDKQKIEELEKSLEAAGIEDPVVFKV